MGSVDCYALCNRLIERAEGTTYQNHYQANKPCNIYIDGLSVWFLGYTNNEPNRANARQKLLNILCHIKSGDYFNVKSVTIYFNGKYPALKCKPISEHVKSFEVQEWSNELFNTGIVNRVEFLEVGEAVSECFFQRDKSVASMIVTNNSNIIPICYKYNCKAQENDTVFCYLTHREIFYDTEYLTTKLDRNAFTLLLLLRGSDNLIEPLFSFTMVNIILDLLLKDFPFYNEHFKKINSIMRELHEANIGKCIVYFIWIMVDAKQSSLGNFKWPPLRIAMQSGNYLQIMKWSIMYSELGKNIDNYNEDFRMPANNERKFDFILSLCTNIFSEFNIYGNVGHFQEIENVMGFVDSDRLLIL